MTREELIEIGHMIVNAEGTEAEINQLLELFDKNIPKPNCSSLFFWHENQNFKTSTVSDYNPTIEDVVDKCLNYKAIQL